MRLKISIPKGICLFLSLCALAQLRAEPVVEIPERVMASGYIVVNLYPDGGVPGFRAELRDLEDRPVSSNVFFIMPETGNKRSVAVLGVPFDLDPGPHTVVLIGEDDRVISFKQIEVVAGSFTAETIALGDSMSELRRTDDPRRVRESRDLRDLLNVRNPTALYHFSQFSNPLSDSIRTSSFGDRRLFVYTDGGTDRSVHSGIDLAAPKGTFVLSSGNGMVAFSGERVITGNTLVIEHLPGVFSLYYHLEELRTAAGDTVGEGQVIGTVGATGLVTGAHLHWEFRIGGVPVDPDVMASFDLKA